MTTHSADALASAWTRHGIEVMNENQPESWRAALLFFDSAIALRCDLPLEGSPWLRFGLAAGWMNRGDCLARMGASHLLRAALASYSESLVHLRQLPLAEPQFRRRLAIALINRGVTFLKRGEQSDLIQAISDAKEARALLEQGAVGIDDARELKAGAWLNQGNAFFRSAPPCLTASLAAAEEALQLAAPFERHNPALAELGLHARHLVCRVIAQTLASPEIGVSFEELVCDATDAVESGLNLISYWEGQGVIHFRPLARELFRFGAFAYQLYQPHFLSEFVLESFGPKESGRSLAHDGAVQASASQALGRALRTIQRDGFKGYGSPQFDRVLELLAQFRLVESFLMPLLAHSALP